MERLIDLDLLQARSVLPILLQDKTTDQNIIWATDTYEAYGDGYSAKEPITSALVTGKNSSIIQPRIAKAISDQADRTKKHAEVFTPAWICNMMVNHCDEVWFGRKNVFNTSEDKHWTPSEAPIEFPRKKRWQRYVDSRRLEITCGEAPYLVSRYDASTGELIPFTHRIGILDRKLRVVNENAENEVEWLKFALRALESVYGFEYQGDNLLIARVNVLMTFMDAVQERLQRKTTDLEIKRAAEIISWNIWQMDGLKGTVPFGSLQEANTQLSIWDLLSEIIPAPEENKRPECQIYDWRGQGKLKYNDRKTRKGKEMKFDFVIGNPPYQETQESTSDKPVYNYFMDAAYQVADRVELITPARFLFDAGKTPKPWNKKMLNDPHLSVLWYEQDSSKVFANTDIKGGIAVTYRDATKDTGAISRFIPNDTLRDIVIKVRRTNDFVPLSVIVRGTEYFKLSQALHNENPTAIENMSRGHQFDLTSNILDKSPQLFCKVRPDDNVEYARIYGRQNNRRTFLYIKKDYLTPCEGIGKYKVILPESNNSGVFGETLVAPFVGDRDVVTTQTFVSIGFFDTEFEATALLEYIKGKFARAMLGTLKITQHNKRETWANVPLQDFTPSSDIDWSVSVAEIDRQLYKKYNLSEEEIAFIETHVKEMA